MVPSKLYERTYVVQPAHKDNKFFSKKHISPYGACWRPKLGHPWGYPPKMEENLSEMRPNRHAKFHADR